MAEESITSQTTQIDSNLEVPLNEVQPGRIPMNPRLLKAARSGDRRILDELLRSGDTRYLLGVTLDGNTALHIAASRGHLEIAKEIYRREITLLAAQNTRLDTPLHCAARAGYDEIVTSIIKFLRQKEIKERVLRGSNREKANALHEAAKYNHVDVANVLMNEDAGLASMLNEAGMSPLYLAITIGSLDVARALLRSSSWENDSPASYAGPNKNTALHAAVLLSREITRDLLDRKPMLAKGVDSYGRIPLHYAALYGHHDTVKLLLKRDPSTAYQLDANGSFPIHIAASRGNVPIIDQILKECPGTYDLLDKKGKNFLHVAFQRRKLDEVKKIISKRPDLSLKKLLNDQDNEGNTLLHTAVKNSDQGSVHFLLRDKTVSVNVINNAGLTPLDLAYGMLNKGLQFWMNEAEVYNIARCLALTKPLSGPRILHDLESGNLSRDEARDDKFKRESRDLARNLGIATVLIATVTFAAGFTVPGGYIQDDHPGRGTAVLAKEYAFKVFIVSDATALVCSIAATFWLMYAGMSIVDTRTRKRAIGGAAACLWVAFVGMSAAFAMGIYGVLPPSCKRIGVILCIIALGAPHLVRKVAISNSLRLLKTVIIRQGYRQCIWPTIHPHDKKRLGHALLSPVGRLIILPLLELGVYAIFFLVAKL